MALLCVSACVFNVHLACLTPALLFSILVVVRWGWEIRQGCLFTGQQNCSECYFCWWSMACRFIFHPSHRIQYQFSKVSPSFLLAKVDSMLGRRENPGEHEAMRKMKNEFMVNWDGLRTKDTERVLVLAATNRPFDLDEAVIRRLPRR